MRLNRLQSVSPVRGVETNVDLERLVLKDLREISDQLFADKNFADVCKEDPTCAPEVTLSLQKKMTEWKRIKDYSEEKLIDILYRLSTNRTVEYKENFAIKSLAMFCIGIRDSMGLT